MLAFVAILASMSVCIGHRLRSPASGTTQEVRLLMVRHGLSCANIISEYGGAWKLIDHKNYPDPLLSDCGVSQTTAAAELLAGEKIDFVGSSYMLRAIETAMLQFKKTPVHVIPHVAEEAVGLKGMAVSFAKSSGVIEDADNTPLPPDVQREILRKHYGNMDVVDFKWANASNPSSWTHFEEFLRTSLLPSIIPQDHEGVFTIAIASHSLFLEASLGKSPTASNNMLSRFMKTEPPSPRETICHEALPLKNGKHTKPDNNQILQLYYDYDKGKQTLELNLQPQKKCKSLGGTPSKPTGVPGTPAVLCEADIQRCVAGWPGATCKAHPRTVEVTRMGADMIAPGECATHHECNSEPAEMLGYTGFPYIRTEEQRWAEGWRAVDKIKDADSRAYPPFPDLNQVCQCYAPADTAQACPE
mmetsp:Transcript_114684/g.180550  ORF Transcript_114684/g.180550 Transcript_114684/m.180550 type:complete len:416 (+) Transcript_114684:81-1328(+)